MKDTRPTYDIGCFMTIRASELQAHHYLMWNKQADYAEVVAVEAPIKHANGRVTFHVTIRSDAVSTYNDSTGSVTTIVFVNFSDSPPWASVNYDYPEDDPVLVLKPDILVVEKEED